MKRENIFEEILIAAIERHEILWNAEHPNYKNIPEKDRTWMEMAVSLDTSVQRCQRHWKNLKMSYKRKINKTPKKPWRHMQRLRFLQKCEGYYRLACESDKSSEYREENITQETIMEEMETVDSLCLNTTEDNVLVEEAATEILSTSSRVNELSQLNTSVSFSNLPDNMSNEMIIPEEIQKVERICSHNNTDDNVLVENAATEILSTSSRVNEFNQLNTSAGRSTTSSLFKILGLKVDESELPDYMKNDIEIKVANLVYNTISEFRNSSYSSSTLNILNQNR